MRTRTHAHVLGVVVAAVYYLLQQVTQNRFGPTQLPGVCLKAILAETSPSQQHLHGS